MDVREKAAYTLAIVGAFVDHASTEIVLRMPGFYETNAFVRRLIELNLWLPVDVLCLSVGILAPAILIRRLNHRYRYIMLAAPVFAGVIRLAAGSWNILQLFT